MEDLRMKQKAEALERLESIKGLNKKVIQDFKTKDVVYYSERLSKIFDGILYYTSNEESIENAIKDFEEKYNCLVYHAILTHTTFGSLLSLLYVSNNIDEWNMDKQCLNSGETCSYVVNLNDIDCSEFGYIGFEQKNGGLSRTY